MACDPGRKGDVRRAVGQRQVREGEALRGGRETCQSV